MACSVGFALRLVRHWSNGWRATIITPRIGRGFVDRSVQFRSGQWMRFKPECAGSRKWIYPSVLPPRTFTAAPMDLTVMRTTDRHGEFVTDLATKRTSLREAEMMRI